MSLYNVNSSQTLNVSHKYYNINVQDDTLVSEHVIYMVLIIIYF